LPDADCESHWIYGDINETELRAGSSTLRDLLDIVQADMGSDAVVELDQELVLSLNCLNCNTHEQVLKPLSAVSFEAGHCPNCGEMRDVNMNHTISGEEDFADRTLLSVGVPMLHIVRATNGGEYRFYELTGDLDEALHFSHFSEAVHTPAPTPRVQLGDEVEAAPEAGDASRRVHLID
jgi:hypothetical protein